MNSQKNGYSEKKLRWKILEHKCSLVYKLISYLVIFPGGTSGKELICKCRRCYETRARSLGWEDPLEEGMGTHSSIFARRIPWTKEPGE